MRYFIADTHFGAKPLLIRGMLRRYPHSQTLFESTEQHDQHMLEAINSTVDRDDELFILGDFAENPGKYRALIKCKHVYLIRGNHDPYQKCVNVFGEMPYVKYTKLRGKYGGSIRCVLSHTPFAFWDGSHKGFAHLYGHCHGQREDCMSAWFGFSRRSMDVGVDNLIAFQGHYAPVSEQTLYYLFLARHGHDLPEFYHEYQARRDWKFYNETL